MISDFLALARWWAVLLLLSMALLPLTLSVFGGLRDKGWAFSKVLGLALCSWLSFTASSFHLVPFRVWGCWLFVGAAALACWLPAFLRRRREGSVWQTALGSGTFWRRALVEEVIFLAALAFWAWLRAGRETVIPPFSDKVAYKLIRASWYSGVSSAGASPKYASSRAAISSSSVLSSSWSRSGVAHFSQMCRQGLSPSTYPQPASWTG